MKLMILDLDGTLCNDTWRKRCLPDYDQYHSGISDDLPNQALFWLMELFMDGGHDMGLGILTSRPERYRTQTIAWLNNLGYEEEDFLFIRMRQEDEKSASPLHKIEALRQLSQPGGPIDTFFGGDAWVPGTLLIEDRDDVIAAYSANHYNYLKV